MNIFVIISKYEDFNSCIYNALGSIRSPKTREIYKSRKLEKQNKGAVAKPHSFAAALFPYL
jgi:hypothetical protein